MPDAPRPSAWLIPLPGGPPLPPMELKRSAGKGRGLVIGRNKDCDLPLPAAAEGVSRRHAEFVTQEGQWAIADLGSRWGTLVNGVTLLPHRLTPLGDGDLIRIHPWTLRFRTRAATSDSTAAIDEDTHSTIVRTHTAAEPLRQDMLNLLLEASSAIQSATDEATLATALEDIARRGTGLPNAVVLRALDSQGNVDVLSGAAARGGATNFRFSRSLLTAAARGVVAEYSGESNIDVSQSIMQANIRAAVCAPIMLGSTVAAFLYVDSRGSIGKSAPLRSNAAGFCQALSRMGGLALANLKRMEIERRAARLEAELISAAAAQKWILPRAAVISGPFTCAGQNRPGGYLGGDFFDAQALSDGRLAVTLGDVSGHGVAASVLMTAAQGFLHAVLSHDDDLERAIARLNAFIQPRCPTDKFITLWTGVFDPAQMTLKYLDAGHGFAMLIKADGALQKLDENGGPPIGVDAAFQYHCATIPLAAGERVLVVSDGILEQFSPERLGPPRQFGWDGVASAVGSAGGQDLVPHLFASLGSFAAEAQFSDDTTGILVQWK